MAQETTNHTPNIGSTRMWGQPGLWVCSLLLALAPLVPGGPSGAMVVRDRDFSDLVATAEQIVVGTVSELRVSRDASGAPLTLVHFADVEVLKGDASEPFVLEMYGGVSAETTVRLSGTPRLSVGDRAVLFVAGNGDQIFPVVGVWQGLFRLRFDEERGAEIVANHARVPVVGLSGRRLRLTGSSAEDQPPPLTLEEFGDLVARELSRQRRGQESARPSE